MLQLNYLKIKNQNLTTLKANQKINELILEKQKIINNQNWTPNNWYQKSEVFFTFNKTKKQELIDYLKTKKLNKYDLEISKTKQSEIINQSIIHTKQSYQQSKKYQTYSSKELAQHLAYVPQILDFPKNIKVYDFVKMGRFPYKKIVGTEKQEEQIILNALKTVEMDKFTNCYLEDLSGGQQQRCLIALALAQNTDTIVLDEPTNHLDIKSQLEIVNLLHKLNREFNKTIILVIHDLNYSIRYANKLLVIKNGNQVAFGDTQQIITPKLLKDVFDINTKIGLDLDNKKYVEYSWLDNQEEHYLNQDSNFDFIQKDLLSSSTIVDTTVLKQLQNIEELFNSKLLSEQEYSQLKQKILFRCQ